MIAAFLVGAIQPACAFVVDTSIRVPSLASTKIGGKAASRSGCTQVDSSMPLWSYIAAINTRLVQIVCRARADSPVG